MTTKTKKRACYGRVKVSAIYPVKASEATVGLRIPKSEIDAIVLGLLQAKADPNVTDVELTGWRKDLSMGITAAIKTTVQPIRTTTKAA